MVTAFLLLGSNLGDRSDHLEKARLQIGLCAGRLFIASSIYETAAWGHIPQRPFLNQVVCIETTLTPEQLLKIIQAVESSLGRVRSEKWAARTLDIDILFYGNEIIDTPDLVIPHPAIQQRRFTLVPLIEVAPGFVHPVLNKTVEVLLRECDDTLAVNVFESDGGAGREN